MSSGVKLNQSSASTDNREVCIGLRRSFEWYREQLVPVWEASSQEFLDQHFMFHLLSVSYEPSIIWKGSQYFVTELKVTKESGAQVKISDTAAETILDKVLGQSVHTRFNLKNISELEARIITSYSQFFFKSLGGLIKEKKRLEKNAQELEASRILYFTFYMVSPEEPDVEAGKIIFSVPEYAMTAPTLIDYPEDPINIMQFETGCTEANVYVGKSRISLEDLEALELDDFVILDNSNIHNMTIRGDEDIPFGVNPDPRIVIDVDNDEGGETMSNNSSQLRNIWDSLQVDVNAEFKQIKMSLGDLRQITEGLVVDIAPIVQNNITLHVEGKDIAKGELVIVGDRYGVRITEVLEQARAKEEYAEAESDEYEDEYETATDEISEQIEDSDFDYGDFELEDDM